MKSWRACAHLIGHVWPNPGADAAIHGRLHARAERQFANLYAFIADASGEARAASFVGDIVADCLSLATFPERGTRRDDIRPNLRTKGYARRVTIAFSVNAADGVVAIHGVFYGGQDVERLLRDADSDE